MGYLRFAYAHLVWVLLFGLLFGVSAAVLSHDEPQPQSATQSATRPILLIGDVTTGYNRFYQRQLNWVREGLAQLGYDTQFVEAPMQRRLVMVAHGLLDGEMMRRPEVAEVHETLVRVDEPLLNLKSWYWTLESSNCPETYEDIVNFRPVGLFGLAYHQKLMRQSKVGFIQATSGIAALKLMLSGRVDFIALSKVEADRMLTLIDINVALKRCLDKPLMEAFYYFYLHENHRHLSSPLAAIIKRLKAESLSESLLPSAGSL